MNKQGIVLPDPNDVLPASLATLSQSDAPQMRLLHQINPTLVTQTTPEGLTAAHIAAMHGHTEALLLLIELQPALESMKDKSGRTPLHLAAGSDQVETLEALCRRNEQSLGLVDNLGHNPVHLAAAFGKVRVLKAIHELDAHWIFSETSSGQTPAHCATIKQDVPVLCALYDLDARTLSQPDHQGRDAWSLANAETKKALERYLLAQKKKPGEQQKNFVAALDLIDEATKLQVMREGVYAAQRYERALELDASLAVLILPSLTQVCQARREDHILNYRNKTAPTDKLLALLGFLHEMTDQNDDDSRYDWLDGGVLRWIQFYLPTWLTGKDRADVDAFVDLLERLLFDKPTDNVRRGGAYLIAQRVCPTVDTLTRDAHIFKTANDLLKLQEQGCANQPEYVMGYLAAAAPFLDIACRFDPDKPHKPDALLGSAVQLNTYLIFRNAVTQFLRSRPTAVAKRFEVEFNNAAAALLNEALVQKGLAPMPGVAQRTQIMYASTVMGVFREHPNFIASIADEISGQKPHQALRRVVLESEFAPLWQARLGQQAQYETVCEPFRALDQALQGNEKPQDVRQLFFRDARSFFCTLLNDHPKGTFLKLEQVLEGHHKLSLFKKLENALTALESSDLNDGLFLALNEVAQIGQRLHTQALTWRLSEQVLQLKEPAPTFQRINTRAAAPLRGSPPKEPSLGR